MPFTPAHPAIVLPLIYLPRKWISMTALIIGSVIPDAEAYLRMYSEKGLSHSWTGFFLFGIPFGLLLAFVFHNIVRDPLINNLPSFLQKKFLKFKEFNWNRGFVKNWPVVFISLIIGGASHFLWDSFSHFDGWLFKNYPGLRGNIFLFDRELEIPYLIQYISSLIGVIIILIFIIRLPSSKKIATHSISLKFWASVLVVSTIIFIPRRIRLPVNSMDDMIIAIISAFALALIFVSLFFKPRNSGSGMQKL
jgi:hypothetical protein